MQKEIWKHWNTNPKYKISSHGRILSNTRGLNKILKPFMAKGYARIQLALQPGSGISKKFFVHILVLETFKGARPLGYQAAHNDGNPGNNNISNLRWATPEDNWNDKRKHGTTNLEKISGQNNGLSKLTNKQVKFIRNNLLHLSNSVIAKQFKVSRTAIYYIRANRTYVRI
jgi:hypothetical protein